MLLANGHHDGQELMCLSSIATAPVSIPKRDGASKVIDDRRRARRLPQSAEGGCRG